MADPDISPRDTLERTRQLVTRLELFSPDELVPYAEDLDEAREGLQAALAHLTDRSPTPEGTPP